MVAEVEEEALDDLLHGFLVGRLRECGRCQRHEQRTCDQYLFHDRFSNRLRPTRLRSRVLADASYGAASPTQA